MQKVIYVKAHFIEVGKNVSVQVPTGEVTKTLFGGSRTVTREETRWKKMGYSESIVDGERLAKDLAKTVKELNGAGWEIESVTPVTSGCFDWKFQAEGISSQRRILSPTEKVSGGASYGYGFGFSYTDSLIVVAKKVD